MAARNKTGTVKVIVPYLARKWQRIDFRRCFEMENFKFKDSGFNPSYEQKIKTNPKCHVCDTEMIPHYSRFTCLDTINNPVRQYTLTWTCPNCGSTFMYGKPVTFVDGERKHCGYVPGKKSGGSKSGKVRKKPRKLQKKYWFD